jgi:ketosteroid isomerase-like protein
MSGGNVELVRRVFEAFNERDLEAFLALMDENVVSGSQLAAIEGDYHGHDGLRRWWNGLFDVLPDFTMNLVDVEDRGDVTVSRLRNEAHSAGSEMPVGQLVWVVARWRDGKVVEWRSCRTEVEAEAVAGAG